MRGSWLLGMEVSLGESIGWIWWVLIDQFFWRGDAVIRVVDGMREDHES